jgi:hypothetical protein
MNVIMIRGKLKAETVAEADAAADKMFAAINAAKPEGVKYASTRLPDGVTAVAFLVVDGPFDPASNPLAAIPEFKEFQAQLPDWLAEPSTIEQLTVVGSYDLF